jgi:hypothetical protein
MKVFFLRKNYIKWAILTVIGILVLVVILKLI